MSLVGTSAAPRPLVEALGDAPSPVDACERFADLPYVLLLESVPPAADDGAGRARYSFLSADPAVVVRSKGRRTEQLWLHERRVERVDGDALTSVRQLLAPFRAEPVAGAPPFQGGAAGYVGYDYGAVLERLPTPRFDDLGVPDVVLGLYDWVVAWDHATSLAWLVSTGFPDSSGSRNTRARRRADSVRRRLAPAAPRRRASVVAVFSGPGRLSSPTLPIEAIAAAAERNQANASAAERAPSFPASAEPLAASRGGIRSSFTRDAYLAAVERVRDYILAGDVFQVNLSQRLEAPLAGSPWALYLRLRDATPSSFGGYLAFDDMTIASASPERFLSVTADGLVETRPIKGTRPRGPTPEEDDALGRDLAASAKDRAENLMIVDLLRNDLSRVCRAGSVRVPELFALERFATVQHLVSTVVGELEAARDAIDLLRAAFPGGSVTGAPKVRAMEIIAELEPSRRGPYCGSLAYLSMTGAMDSSIVIRSFIVAGGRAHFSAGGGIVADSDPEQEYRETWDKARALVAALDPAPSSPASAE